LPQKLTLIRLANWKFADSDGFCGLGLKVGNDGDFGIVFKGKRPQNTPFLLSNGAF